MLSPVRTTSSKGNHLLLQSPFLVPLVVFLYKLPSHHVYGGQNVLAQGAHCTCACRYMYVQVCTCMCMYVCTYVHVCMCACMHMYMYVCVHVLYLCYVLTCPTQDDDQADVSLPCVSLRGSPSPTKRSSRASPVALRPHTSRLHSPSLSGCPSPSRSAVLSPAQSRAINLNDIIDNPTELEHFKV